MEPLIPLGQYLQQEDKAKLACNAPQTALIQRDYIYQNRCTWCTNTNNAVNKCNWAEDLPVGEGTTAISCVWANPHWNDLELLVTDNLEGLVSDESCNQLSSNDDSTLCLCYQQFHLPVSWQRSEQTAACWHVNRVRNHSALATDCTMLETTSKIPADKSGSMVELNNI